MSCVGCTPQRAAKLVADRQAVAAPSCEMVHDAAIKIASHSRTKCHDRIRKNLPTARFDHCSRRYRGIGRERGSGYCHFDARAGGQGVAENREVSGHAERRATLRKLHTVRSPIDLQNGGWNCCRARLVHGLCEEADINLIFGPLSALQHILRVRVETVELSANQGAHIC